MYTSALISPARYQWESSSGTFVASQSNNCGPASMTKIADFYRDSKFGIEATRRLAAPCCRGTSPGEQSAMLRARGVQNGIYSISSLTQIRNLVGTAGRRPIGIGVYCARVPSAYRGHSFLGWHSIVVMAWGYKNGVRGFWIMDPNFSPPGGSRPDPYGGKRFYPDWVMQYAFIDYSPRYAIVPVAPKYVPPSQPPTDVTVGGLPVNFTSRTGWHAVIKSGKPRRSGASISSSNYGNTTKNEGFGIWGEVAGEDLGKYGLPGGKRWFFGPQYIKGWKVVYIPYADLINLETS